MRLAPAAIVDAYRRPNGISVSVRQSQLTHPSKAASEVASRLGKLLVNLMQEATTGLKPFPASTLAPNCNGGMASEAYEMAFWSFRSTNSFEACVPAAANLGVDADSVAAVTGQIAGAQYGFVEIAN